MKYRVVDLITGETLKDENTGKTAEHLSYEEAELVLNLYNFQCQDDLAAFLIAESE